MKKLKIISGAQTGVDRAALDAAMSAKISTGGWCPKGRLAEDGKIPVNYKLKETSSRCYRVRTRKNVLDSDGTLILNEGAELSAGTALTLNLAKKSMKPLFVADVRDVQKTQKDISAWLSQNKIRILNVAGPRESMKPGIYQKAFQFMKGLLLNIKTSS